MRFFTKRNSRFSFQVTNSDQATAHGGQVLVDALCQRFGLWKKIDDAAKLDPRKRKDQGFAPRAIIAQLLFTLTSGGVSLADAERLGQDPVLLDLVGLDKGADQSTLGEWLRAQTPESLLELLQLNWDLVSWARAQVKPARYLRAGTLDVFFDDTEIEVHGKHYEGARINYEGQLALSLQTLWLGPFWLDGILDGAPDPSQHLPALVRQHQPCWAEEKSHFFADSASSVSGGMKMV